MARARLAQSAERKALNLVVVGSSPTVGVLALPQRLVRPAALKPASRQRVARGLAKTGHWRFLRMALRRRVSGGAVTSCPSGREV